MGTGAQGRLLIYTHVDGWLPDPVPPADLIELSASVQRRSPRQVVEPADLEWLRQVVGESLPLPVPEEVEDRLGPLPPLAGPESFEHIYLVLGWLAGTVSRQVAEAATKAAADLIREWMRSRRSKKGDTTQVRGALLHLGQRRRQGIAKWRRFPCGRL
jgi:hypothetical protein